MIRDSLNMIITLLNVIKYMLNRIDSSLSVIDV
jgi:hypothetical protein